MRVNDTYNVQATTTTPPTTTPETVPTPSGCQPPARPEPPHALRIPANARWQLQLLVDTINRYNDSPTDLLTAVTKFADPATEANRADAGTIAAAITVRHAMHLVAAVNAVNRQAVTAVAP